MKILITDTFSRASLDLVEQSPGVELLYRPGISAADLFEVIAEVDALAVRGGTRIDAELLHRARSLRAISRAGIGVENIDLEQANHQGIVVMNTPFGSATTTAEHTIAMLLALARNLPAADASVRRGDWDKDRFLGVEISGKVLGVVGAGKIGRLVIGLAKALGMKTLVHDPYLSPAAVTRLGATQVELEELLQTSDFISLHLPLNQETANLLDGERLQQLKAGARVINCATGGLIDEEALARELSSGRLAGAAIDVFSVEPPPGDHPLRQCPNAIFTPHLRAATVDAQINVTVQAVQQLLDFLQHGQISNALNAPSVSAEQVLNLRPQVELAEKLGLFQAQYNPRGHKRLTIEYSGELADESPLPLTMALLKGLLTPVLGSMVNHVNAPQLAAERGLEFIESRTDARKGYAGSIRLSLSGEAGETTVRGALFGGEARIVEIDGHPLEIPLQGEFLLLHHRDQTGVIGFIGQSLGDSGINIARMNVSRKEESEQVLCLLLLDNHPDPDQLQQLCAHPAIGDAHLIKL